MKPIIKVEGLGKKYHIQQKEADAPMNFRELLMDLPRRLLKGGAKTSVEEFWALRDVSLDILPGERVGIIGRNGAGKSTLLKLLSRITEPTKGKITMRGRVASLLEVGTGFHPELTGRENIFLNGAILGMSKKEILRKFDEIVDFAGVEAFLDVPVKRYSSGMYVRLGFAVAAHMEPEILIVDEVLAVGDVEFQKKCLGKMEKISTGEGRTVLFVSHNLMSVRQLCGSAYLIGNGGLIYSGETSNVINYYTGLHTKALQGEWMYHAGSQQNGDCFLPTRLAILDKNHEVVREPIPAGEPLFVQIEGICQEKNAALQLGFALLDVGDSALLRSMHTDEVDDRLWPQVSIGHNSFLVELPYGVLNSGKYKIQFLSAIYQTKWIHSPSESPIMIEFELTQPKRQSCYLTGGRPCVLAPVLSWQKQCVGA